MIYEFRIQPEQAGATYALFGGARDFVRYHGAEAIVHGPAETGKTLAALIKIHGCASEYPNASLVVARKTLNSIFGTVWQTFYKRILGTDLTRWPCEAYGGEKRPERLLYFNESTVWFAGFDKSSKILSAEHDIVYINQVEELTEEDWQTCTTRTTGRAGNMPYAQTIGDANPTWPSHWMYHRPSIKMFHSRHSENPALYDQQTGELTAQGEQTMRVLNNLTGMLRERLLIGRAVQAEGAILTEYNEAKNLIYLGDVPKCDRFVAGVDWGYRNPGAMLVFGIDGTNGVMHKVAEYYHTRRLDNWWLEKAIELNDEYHIEAFACDPSEPTYIVKFAAAGLNAVAGFNAVVPGINAIQARLKDNTLLFARDTLREPDQALVAAKLPKQTTEEIAGYVWSNKATKEAPVKENDHGIDATRYAVMYVDGRDTDILIGFID